MIRWNDNCCCDGTGLLRWPALMQQYLRDISTFSIDFMPVLDDTQINIGCKESNSPAYSQVQTVVNHRIQL